MERSKIGKETRKILIDPANQDSFMKASLDRRFNRRLDSKRIRVREEEVDKFQGRVRKKVADGVREVVAEQVREELKPDLDRVDEERERIRAEERAELQRQYDELEKSRQAMEEERLRAREEELARLRVEFAMSVAAEGPAAAGAENEGDVGAPEGVVAVLDGESGGPAEVQNEVPENAMEPEAKDFDPEAFLSVRG